MTIMMMEVMVTMMMIMSRIMMMHALPSCHFQPCNFSALKIKISHLTAFLWLGLHFDFVDPVLLKKRETQQRSCAICRRSSRHSSVR